MNNAVSKPRRGRPSKKPLDENRIPLPGDIIISILFSVFYGKYRLRFPKIRLVLSAEFVQEG